MILNENQQKITKRIKKTKWEDWTWQIKHTIKTLKQFEQITEIKFSEEEKNILDETIRKFPLSITPYYVSLIDLKNYKTDPVYLQSFPSPKELDVCVHEMSDPLSEDKDSPVPHLTHRYPDRVLLHVSNLCSMYCRHCTRKRKVGDRDSIPVFEELEKAFKYIENNTKVRDVLLSGGDPLMLPDDYLDKVLNRISQIPHVEIIRIGTRMPVVLPYRITTKLIKILKKYQPLYINTHFNHPREITNSAKKALAMLVNAGIVLGNQSVLLSGINDCPRIIKTLCQKLVQNRVRPYYLYQCDLSEGLTHFRTPINKGIEILESLIGHTSGFARPTYVIDAPGGGGKIPVEPNYIISHGTNKVILRNYEGIITTYKEPDSYEATFCDRDCVNCKLQLNLEEANKFSTIGIEKLLSNTDKTISLIPSVNQRIKRREKNKINK
ncbi:MAG: lysine 2,3-aminomutase [Endomicrobiaceae bacterium]|nr:lysine 2,3-aminomutase [Endomicrobiaceae bacterium]